MTTELLDSTISSNSQELPNASSALKLFENPQFRVRVIMRCADPWFVASDACDGLALSNVSKALADLDEDDKLKLTKDELDTLTSSEGIKCSVDSRVQSLNLVSESGLYDLIMQSRKPEAKAFKRWVTHEVLPSIRKTGGYSVQTQSMMLPNFCNPSEAARAWADLYEKNQAAEKRAITAEADLASEKEAHEKDNVDFRTGLDIINAQKAQIGSNREATAMATASAKSRECKRLTAENAELKDAVGRGMNWHTVNMMTAEWKRDFGHAPVWQKLMKFSADLPIDMQPIKDVEVKAVLKNGSEKVSLVNRYHREAWAKYREYEENSRVRGKNVPNTKILDLKATDTDLEVF